MGQPDSVRSLVDDVSSVAGNNVLNSCRKDGISWPWAKTKGLQHDEILMEASNDTLGATPQACDATAIAPAEDPAK